MQIPLADKSIWVPGPTLPRSGIVVLAIVMVAVLAAGRSLIWWIRRRRS